MGVKVLSKIKWKEDCKYVLYDFVVIENQYNMSLPSDSVFISIEILNDSLYKQTVLLEKSNFLYTSLVSKTDDEAPALSKYETQ